MSLSGTSPVDWLQLSPELWGHIFTYLKPRQHDVLAGMRFRNSHTESFYRLHEVCKTFHQVFQTHLQLHSSVYVGPKTAGSSSDASLFKWLCRHRTSVQNLVSPHDSRLLEAVLALLIDAPVTTIYLAHVGAVASTLLAQFKFVTTCVITHSLDTQLGLALGAASNLTCLTLENGKFDEIDAAVNLTSLTLQHCVATCSKACDCVTSLLELKLEDTNLRLHEQGLHAFSCLQYLSCERASVEGNVDADSLHVSWVPKMPMHLSELMALTKLHLRNDGTRYQPDLVKLDWLTMVQNLRSVSAHLYASEVELPKALSCMVNLTNLEVWCASKPYAAAAVLRMDLGLTSLVSLERLMLSSPIIDSSCHNLIDLVSLKNLKQIKYSCNPGVATTQDLIDLFAKIGCVRPDMSIEFTRHDGF